MKPASLIKTGRPFRHHRLTALLRGGVGLGALLVALPLHAAAGPEGGTVVQGTATIAEGTGTLTEITQTSTRAVIDWRGFSLATNETVVFKQPTAASVTLNRVTTGSGSVISGAVTANGRVFLLDPRGVLVTQGAVLDVNSLVLTTAAIDNAAFMAGDYSFTGADTQPSAGIINQGTILADPTGFVALVGTSVDNQGTITAQLGTVALGAAPGFTLDFAGDGLIAFDVTGALSSSSLSALPAALVANSGTIQAHGGTVRMSVAQATRLLNNAISLGGAVEATSVSTRAGAIVLEASAGDIAVSGRVTALGDNTGERGGSIRAQADTVRIAEGAVVNVSGDSGGGSVRIGETATPVQAIDIARTAIIRADAIRAGAGGSVTLAASGTLSHAGLISAAGLGPTVGRGGTVTMAAGTRATVEGQVTAQGHAGTATGTWSLTIAGDLLLAAAPDLSRSDLSYVSTATVQAALNNVTSVSLAGAGDLAVNSPLVRTLGTTTLLPGLDLKAGGNVTLATAASLRGSTARGLHVSMAANSGAVAGDPDPAAGTVTVNAAISTFGGRFSSSGVDFTSSAAITTNTAAIDIRHTGLVNIGNALSTTGTAAGNLTIAAGQGAGQGIRLGASLFTSGGTISLTGPTTLLADTSLSAGTGNITVDGSIDGARSLALNAAGTTTLNGAVGGTTALTTLTADAGVSLTAGSVRTTGAQTYADTTTNLSGSYTTNVAPFTASGTVNVASGTVINTNSGALTLGPVKGSGSLRLVNLFGALTLSGIDGLSSLNISSDVPVVLTGGTYKLGGDAVFAFAGTRLAGDILFGTAADLGTATLVGTTSLTADGAIVKAAAISGSSQDLRLAGTIDIAGTVAVQDLQANGTITIAGSASVRDLTNTGTTHIAGSLIGRDLTTTGVLTTGGDTSGQALSLAGTVDIGGSVTATGVELSGAGSAISIAGSFTANSLTSANTPLTLFVGGDGTVTNRLSLDPATVLSARNLWTVGGDATFGTVALIGDLRIDGAGAVTVAGPVDGASALTVRGAGAVVFQQAVGAGARLSAADLRGASLSLTGVQTQTGQAFGGAITLAGDYSSTEAGFTATGPVTLSAATTLTMKDQIRFDQTLDGPGALTARTQGNTLFAGAVGTVTPLAGLSVAADGDITFTGSATVTGMLSATAGRALWFKDNVRAAILRATAATGMTLGNGPAVMVDAADGAEFAGRLSLAGDTKVTASTARFAGAVNAAAQGGQGLQVNGDATFTDRVGDSGALKHLTVTGTGHVAADVTTTGDQSYATTILDGPVAFTSRQGRIDFARSLSGAHALTVGAAGAARFGGLLTTASASIGGRSIGGVGMTTTGSQRLTADILNMSGTYVSGTGDITWTGAQKLSGPVNLSAATISLTGGMDAATAEAALTARATDTLTLAVDIGSTAALSSLDLSARTLLLGTGTGAAFRTTGGQTATGAVRLTSDLLLVAGGDVQLNGTLDSQAGSARNLVINSSGTTTLTRDVGSNQALARLITDAQAGTIGGLTVSAADATRSGGITRLGTGAATAAIRVETTQEQLYGDRLELAADTVLNTQGGLNVTGIVRGDGVAGRDLAVNSLGDTAFLGGVSTLASLTTDASRTGGTLRVNGATDIASQTYGEATTILSGSFSGDSLLVLGAAQIAGPTTIAMGRSATNIGSVSFVRSINAASAATDSTLTVTTGSAATGRGGVTLGGAVGDMASLSALTVTGGAVNAAANIQTRGALDITGTSIGLGGTLYAAGKGLTLTGPVDLRAGTATLSVGDGDLHLAGTVDGAAALSLIRTGVTGRLRLDGDVGGRRPLTSLTLSAGFQTIVNAGLIQTTGAQQWGGGLALARSATLSGTTLSFAGNVWSSGAEPASLTVNGTTNVTFNGDVGVAPDNQAGGSLRTLAINATRTTLAPTITGRKQVIRTIRGAGTGPGGASDADGAQSYSGNVTLSAAGAVFDTTGRWQPGASSDTLGALFPRTGATLTGGNLVFPRMDGGAALWLLGNGNVLSPASIANLPQIELSALTVAGQGGDAQIEGLLNRLTGEVAAQRVEKIGRRSNDYRLNDCAMGNPTCIVVGYSAPPVPETVSIPAFPVAERVIRFDPTGVIRGNEDLWPDRVSDDDKKGDAP